MSILYRIGSGYHKYTPGYTKWICDKCGKEAFAPVMTDWLRMSIMQPPLTNLNDDQRKLGANVRIEWHLCPECHAPITDLVREVAREPIVVQDTVKPED